jgi:peroxiredoxin Q/BCP
MLKSGESAPSFELVSDSGETVRLSDFKGKRVIVYFYPKADTPGCTKQACAIQDIGPQIEDAGVTVIGISPDPPEKLAKFREKYGLRSLRRVGREIDVREEVHGHHPIPRSHQRRR